MRVLGPEEASLQRNARVSSDNLFGRTVRIEIYRIDSIQR